MTSYYRLTTAQLAIWFAQKFYPESAFYNIGEYLEITGAVDSDLLEASVRSAFDQTDTLRLRFVDSDESPRQYFASDSACVIQSMDFSHEADPHYAAKTWMVDNMASVGNLVHGPLYTFVIFKISPDCVIYYQRFHHIIMDGVGVFLFAQKVADLYSSLFYSKPPELKAFGSWLDVLENEEVYLNSTQRKLDRDYWLDLLRDMPGPVTLSGKPPASLPYTQFCSNTDYLAYSAVEALTALGSTNGLSLNRIIIAALALYLHRFTGERDIVLSMPVTARTDAEMRNIPGMMTNTTLLRLTVNHDTTVGGYLNQAASVISDALLHQRYRIEDLCNDLGITPTDHSVHGMVVNIMPGNYYDLDFAGCPVQLHCRIPNEPMFELSVNIYDSRNASDLRFDFNGSTLHYSEEDLTLHNRRLLDFLTRLAFAASTDPYVNQLNLLGDEERRTLLYEWNATSVEYPRDRCVHELFEAQVVKDSEAIALVYEGGELTYAGLNAQANRLARHLRGLGVGPDKIVGLCIGRGPDLIIGILAILKAGGAYVPLDPNYPLDRLAYMLEDSKPLLLLVEGGADTHLPVHRTAPLPVVRMDADRHLWAGQSDENMDYRDMGLGSGHLAYVIYTSGSTGKPKGVMLEHQGLSNLVSVPLQGLEMKPGDRFLQFGSLSFDACMFETSLTLCRGATLCLAPPGVVLVGDALLEAVDRYAITHVEMPPAVLAALPEEAKLDTVKVILASGEALSGSLARRWAANHHFINGYGPTETTICATLHECNQEETEAPSIGRPIPNKRVYILDDDREPVPIGATGELYIGGVGVGRGYLNHPELTVERFLTDPFSTEPGARMYRTGDLGRWLANGEIEFVGRNDFQVKIRGLRIELGEIEAALSLHPAVREAVVLAREDMPGAKRLVAYYLVDQGSTPPAPSELWSFLRSRLPDFMVPSAFVTLDALPLTPNGKLDRKALPQPLAKDAHQSYSAPRNQTEKKLIEIWESLLGVKHIGIHDNFFSLGGNSLLSVKLLAEVKIHFNTELTPVAAYQFPTVEELARNITFNDRQSSFYSIVPIQSSGSRPPLFAIHTITLQDLPKYLGHDQPLYFIRYAMASENSDKPVRLPSLVDLASHYIKEMKQILPSGSYNLIGFSFGGIIAYEMACQLVAGGDKVNLVGLLDTYLTKDRKLLPLHCIIYNIIKKIKTKSLPLLNNSNTLSPKNDENEFWPNIYTSAPDVRCYNSYKANVYNGRVTLFQGFKQETAFYTYDIPEHAWRNFLGDRVEVQHVSGSHFDIVREPHVKILAEKIMSCMDKATTEFTINNDVA